MIAMVLLHANRQGICSTSESTFLPRRDILWPTHKVIRPKIRCIVSPNCSIKARWSIDIKYGVKLDAVALLQEWVTQIGSQAGLNLARTQILSGAIGIPESRLVVSNWPAKPNTCTSVCQGGCFAACSTPSTNRKRMQNFIIIYLCVQMEVDFDTLSELEAFWSGIPQQDHKAWSERARVGSLTFSNS